MDAKATADKLLKGDISGVVDEVKSTIKRSLTLVGVIIVTVAASIGSGLFVLPSFAAAVMGPGIWLARKFGKFILFNNDFISACVKPNKLVFGLFSRLEVLVLNLLSSTSFIN